MSSESEPQEGTQGSLGPPVGGEAGARLIVALLAAMAQQRAQQAKGRRR